MKQYQFFPRSFVIFGFILDVQAYLVIPIRVSFQKQYHHHYVAPYPAHVAFPFGIQPFNRPLRCKCRRYHLFLLCTPASLEWGFFHFTSGLVLCICACVRVCGIVDGIRIVVAVVGLGGRFFATPSFSGSPFQIHFSADGIKNTTFEPISYLPSTHLGFLSLVVLVTRTYCAVSVRTHARIRPQRIVSHHIMIDSVIWGGGGYGVSAIRIGRWAKR